MNGLLTDPHLSLDALARNWVYPVGCYGTTYGLVEVVDTNTGVVGARTLLGAPGLTTRNKNATSNKGHLCHG